MKKQKIILLVLGIGIGIIIGAAAGYVIGYSANKKQVFTPEVQPQTVTLEGKMICLTHKNEGRGDEPHTLECAIGFQTSDNKTYGISTNPNDITLSSAAGSDKKVRITGTVTSTVDDKYNSVGTLKVSNYEFIK